SVGLDEIGQPRDVGPRRDARHEPGCVLEQDAGRRSVREAADDATRRVPRVAVDTGQGEGRGAHPDAVEVVRPQEQGPSRRDAVEVRCGRPAAPPCRIPAGAPEPLPRGARRRGQPLVRRPDEREGIVGSCRIGEVELAGGDRRIGQVEVGVGQAGQGDLVGREIDPSGASRRDALDVGGGAGRQDPAVPDRDRLDDPQVIEGSVRERHDPTTDDEIGAVASPVHGAQRVETSATGSPGSASSAAKPVRSSPAPTPSDIAIRAFGPLREPAGIAPARSQFAFPPGNAYPLPTRPAGTRLASATGIPPRIARSAASRSPSEVLPLPVAATTMPRAPSPAAASMSEPSMPVTAVMRKTGSAATPVATCRRPARRRWIATRPPTIWPSGPRFGLPNAVNELVCIFATSSGAWIVPPRTTVTPSPRRSGAAAARTASVRFDGPS